MFAVIWTSHALDELADIWVAATSEERALIELDIQALNRRLHKNALQEGEVRAGAIRSTYAGEIGVAFEVKLTADTVRVLHVWLVQDKGP